MSLDRLYRDIPGVTILNTEQPSKDYWPDQFWVSLILKRICVEYYGGTSDYGEILI